MNPTRTIFHVVPGAGQLRLHVHLLPRLHVHLLPRLHVHLLPRLHVHLLPRWCTPYSAVLWRHHFLLLFAQTAEHVPRRFVWTGRLSRQSSVHIRYVNIVIRGAWSGVDRFTRHFVTWFLSGVDPNRIARLGRTVLTCRLGWQWTVHVARQSLNSSHSTRVFMSHASHSALAPNASSTSQYPHVQYV